MLLLLLLLVVVVVVVLLLSTTTVLLLLLPEERAPLGGAVLDAGDEERARPRGESQGLVEERGVVEVRPGVEMEEELRLVPRDGHDGVLPPPGEGGHL
jgi:hypothetical protein